MSFELDDTDAIDEKTAKDFGDLLRRETNKLPESASDEIWAAWKFLKDIIKKHFPND